MKENTKKESSRKITCMLCPTIPSAPSPGPSPSPSPAAVPPNPSPSLAHAPGNNKPQTHQHISARPKLAQRMIAVVQRIRIPLGQRLRILKRTKRIQPMAQTFFEKILGVRPVLLLRLIRIPGARCLLRCFGVDGQQRLRIGSTSGGRSPQGGVSR